MAEAFIADTCLKQEIVPGTLSIHADHGSSMTSRQVAHLLADLDVAKTHSRPHVSNDNSYSESAFKTLKYRPNFPDRFGSIQDSRCFCWPFFHWYNDEHHHAGIAMFTPYEVHYGLVEQVAAQRQKTLLEAYRNNPERFTKGAPVVNLPPKEVWINNPNVKEQQQNHSLITNHQLSHFYLQVSKRLGGTPLHRQHSCTTVPDTNTLSPLAIVRIPPPTKERRKPGQRGLLKQSIPPIAWFANA
ncbi:MAG: transposase [Chitinispirillaceae bacterium]|nr:transposase [Chitinispirillaceae bacterium]